MKQKAYVLKHMHKYPYFYLGKIPWGIFSKGLKNSATERDEKNRISRGKLHRCGRFGLYITLHKRMCADKISTSPKP